MPLPTEIIELDFRIIEFYENYMSTTHSEVVTSTEKNVSQIQSYASAFYKDKSFGYMSYRVNDYSRNISPKSYTRKFPKLLAFAIVCKTEFSLDIANFEKFFIKRSEEHTSELQSRENLVCRL